jgi:hypothetical protein
LTKSADGLSSTITEPLRRNLDANTKWASA